MTLIQSIVFLIQFALIVILGTIVLVKWTAVLISLLWRLWARKKVQ